jgi:Ca-activated chloride channel family protein
VIIFDRYTPKFVPPAGGVVSFGAVPPGIRLGIARTPTSQPMVMEDVEVLDWKRDHPLLRGLSLVKLYVGPSTPGLPPPALRLLPAIEPEVLVEGTRGPLIVLHREGRQTHIVCAFDLLQTNWPLRVSFPVFLHSALQYLAIGSDMDVRQSLPPGATPRIPRANLQRVDPNLKSIQLSGPMGSRKIDIPESGDFALPSLDQYERIAVNLLDSSESNLLPVREAPGGIGEVIEGGKGKARLELWWWLVACGAIPLLLIEWWVYTQRVHL